ncbi:hypothetical protein BASA62_000309 [Batrachochytrium salamandrivorans]|nr:hypothetical protein BASA62_000309 [Batrachochytrium salamandrivorans]
MFGPALTLILALVSSAVIAVPMVDNVYKRAVASLDPSSTEFPFYFPESVYESIPHSGAPPSPSSERMMPRLPLISSPKSSISARMISRWSTPTLILLAAAHVKNGEVTFFSSSFGTDQHLAKRDLAVSAPEATLSFEEVSVYCFHPTGVSPFTLNLNTLEYVAQSDGKVVYAYKFQLRDNPVTRWVEVWCDATTGEVIQAVNFANKASYKVIALPRRDPTEGFQWYPNLEFKRSSPKDGLMARLLRVTTPSPLSPQWSDEHVSLHYTTPNRNPGFDNAIVIHEYAHGISNRLTGGPATAGVSAHEARGMGEGWSDIMAMIVLAKSSDTATTGIPIGAYVKTTQRSAGNIVAMKIIIGGMMIQSCNPTFLGARDAIIAADVIHYKGANKCEIYKGFAKRGLGLGATTPATNDFSVPPECQ